MASYAPELIHFLDDHWCSVMSARAAQHPLGNTPEETLRRLKELRQAFLNDLSKMPTDQLVSTAREVMIEQDLARPFNQLGTEADFEHFGKCAFLTAPEAVSLSLGKDPRFVDWAMVRTYLGKSVFAFEYAKRLDLIDRAVIWKELPERFTPLEFVTWAHKYKLQVPEAFIQCTFDRGEPIQYWHDLCEVLHGHNLRLVAELQATQAALDAERKANDEQAQRTLEEWLDGQDQFDRLNSTHDVQIASHKEAFAQLEKKNVALVEQINAKSAEAVPDDAITTTERKSLLTIIIGSAVGGYGYDPKSKKSPAPQEIASEAQRLGLKMTNETVSKYLKEAATLKGFVAPDMDRPKPNSAYQKPKSL